MIDDIIAGVRTYQRDVYPQYRELFTKLAAGQSPKALVITCSDSRVDPFLFMNAQPGQLFVIRNAGNLVPKFDGLVGGMTATIEFAVIGLQVPNIIVCGHSGCGAVTGLLHPEELASMPLVRNWLSHHAEPVLDILANAGRLGSPEELSYAVDANVLVQLENLREHTCVADALREGRIKLHGWVYDFVAGSIRAYDDEQKQFAAL